MSSQHQRDVAKAVIWLVLASMVGCKPADKKMLVTCVQATYFYPICALAFGILANFWNVKSQARLQRGLIREAICFCAVPKPKWLGLSIKSELYKNARTLFVAFHSTGHGSGRNQTLIWTCKRSEIIDCG
jgi:hypothetical protein